jgi:hypothetical protein
MKSLLDPGCHAAVVARLRSLSPEAPARWGRFTAPRMLVHLSDQVRSTLGDVEVAPIPGVLRCAAEAMRRDLRRELEELLGEAEKTDPFEPYYMTRTTADQIVVVYAALGEWHKAMDWVERSYERRPVRLRRLLSEPPFDRRGLAVDPRYARLLRAAVMEDLL